MLKSLMIVGCGSFVGGALRYLLTRTVQNWFDGWMPAGTLAVNVLGCLNENMQMLRISDAAGMCLNVVVSLVAGVVALYAGYQAARLF